MADLVTLVLAAVVRCVQVLIEASSTILCGLVVAGVLRAMVGPAGIRRLLGGRGWVGQFRAWGLGMLLPVCSLGVIPVAREMRRAGVPAGTVLAFVLAAPLLNPISFLYGLTLSEPIVICVFAGASLLLALVAGQAWDWFFPASPDETAAVDAIPRPAPGLRRLAAVVVYAGREAVGPVAGYVVLAGACSGLLAAALPQGALQPYMRHSDPWSVPLMAAIAPIEFNSPLPGMMKIGLMFEHGNSVGAAFVLFVFGLGVNVGLFAWVAGEFGTRRAAAWFGLVLVATIALGFAFEPTLFPAGKEEADHTHAFDDFTSPFPRGSEGSVVTAVSMVRGRLELLEQFAIAALGAFVLVGLAARAVAGRWDVDAFLTAHRPPPDGPLSAWNRAVPGPVLGALALIGLAVFSGYGAFIYYPPKHTVFEDMARVRTEAVFAARAHRKDDAIRYLEELDLLTRKLQVGIYLRTLTHDPDNAAVADEYREAIEKLRDAIRLERWEEADRHLAAPQRPQDVIGPVGGALAASAATPSDPDQYLSEIERLGRAVRRVFGD